MGEASSIHHEKSKGVEEWKGEKGCAAWAQVHAQEAANFFKDFVPLATHNEIETIEKHLWEEFKAMPIEEVHQEFEAWVVDPSNTDGMAAAYDRIPMLYRVNKNLLA